MGVIFNHTPWTEEEKETLKILWKTTVNKDIAERLNRTKEAIDKKGRDMGLGRKRAWECFWPEDRTEALKRLWAEGLSASCIAKRLGEGLTRSAVLGKVHRIGLPHRHTTTKQKQLFRRRYKPRQDKPVYLPKMRPVKAKPILIGPDSLNIPFKAIKSRQCRYMKGEDHICCGHETRVGLSWCDYHFSVVYRNDRRTTSMANQHQQLMAYS